MSSAEILYLQALWPWGQFSSTWPFLSIMSMKSGHQRPGISFSGKSSVLHFEPALQLLCFTKNRRLMFLADTLGETCDLIGMAALKLGPDIFWLWEGPGLHLLSWSFDLTSSVVSQYREVWLWRSGGCNEAPEEHICMKWCSGTYHCPSSSSACSMKSPPTLYSLQNIIFASKIFHAVDA